MEAHPKAKARAVRHTAGTFAGRRPPTNPEKLEVFMKMKEIYYETRPDQQQGPSKKRKGSTNQNQYYAFMQKEMAKLASAGVNGGERMKRAAEAWRARTFEDPAEAVPAEGVPDESGPAADGLGSLVEGPVVEQADLLQQEAVSWILFEGATEPLRLDQLTAPQEMQLENGKPYRYVAAPLL